MKILIAGLFIVLVGITTISSCNAFEINNYTNNQNNQNIIIEVLDPIDKKNCRYSGNEQVQSKGSAIMGKGYK